MNLAQKILIAAGLLLASPVLAQPYSYSTDGAEVIDSKTGLTWRRCNEGLAWNGNTCAGTALRFTHEQALAHAQTQAGWRLPNVKELQSIVDRSRSDPAIDTIAFPGTPSWGHWTSSPDIRNPSYAWHNGFSTGGAGSCPRSDADYVRLVR